MSVPSIGCIGIIGRHDNPLHISVFPPFEAQKSALLELSFLLNASLDIFDARCRDPNRIDQDLGLLQAIDDRLSIWGWQTGTGARFAIIVDTWGKEGRPVVERKGTGEGKEGRVIAGKGVQDADVRPAFKALQTAYIKLLQNPFYTPDDNPPMAVAHGKGKSGEIKSKKFIQELLNQRSFPSEALDHSVGRYQPQHPIRPSYLEHIPNLCNRITQELENTMFIRVKVPDSRTLHFDIDPDLTTIGQIKNLINDHYPVSNLRLLHNIMRLDDDDAPYSCTLSNFGQIKAGDILRLEKYKEYQQPTMNVPAGHVPVSHMDRGMGPTSTKS
ncbi:MAG: hypothetical protein Q9163_004692 [Psora crenata]